MADMLQKQLEGSMHGPGGGGSSALGPRPSLATGGQYIVVEVLC